MRPSGRAFDQLRDFTFERGFTKHAEGSVLASCGDTVVLCNASVENRVPPFLKGSGKGWVTAEYSMLPRSTHTRMRREISLGKPNARSTEIQRLIGRALRQSIDLKVLGERSITLDCDVIQADGGTRTTAISGAYVALVDAITAMGDVDPKKVLLREVAATSVGIFKGQAVLDLDYDEDSNAQTDMNVVMDHHGAFIEVQGSAEAEPFPRATLDTLLDLAQHGITQIFAAQRNARQ